MSLALKGIKVVDVSQAVAAPTAARHLGDFGADVIHVEPPLTGDSWRGGQGFPPSEIDYSFETFNRNKRSLSLDLSGESGQAVMYKLLEEADVFVTNMRPSEQKRYRIDYATLHEHYPRLIHGSISGVGKNGPERDLPCYDATALWFRSGIHYALATGGMGWRAGFGDTVAGMSLFAGIMTALYTREQTGIGQQVDLSLFNVGVYQLSHDMAGFLTTGTDAREMVAKIIADEGDTPRTQLLAQLRAEVEATKARLGKLFSELGELLSEYFGTTSPLLMPYQTKDGRTLKINIMLPDRYHPRMCRVIGREDLTDDPRFATYEPRVENGPALYQIMRDAFLTKTLDEWRPILNREEIPWAPEQTFREVANDPQARANDFFIPFDHPSHGRMEIIANPIKLSETPATVRLSAPEFSQHTEEILLEMGYSWEDIAQFKEQGTIA